MSVLIYINIIILFFIIILLYTNINNSNISVISRIENFINCKTKYNIFNPNNNRSKCFDCDKELPYIAHGSRCFDCECKKNEMYKESL